MKRPASMCERPSSSDAYIARSFCCVRQRKACRGRSNSADSARSAACRKTNAATSSNSTRLSETSTRYGGQNSVTVPWLLPANRAPATAMPNRARSQRVARMAALLPGRGRRQGSHGLVDARQLHVAHLRLHLLQLRGGGLRTARGRVEILLQGDDGGGDVRAGRVVLPRQQRQARVQQFQLQVFAQEESLLGRQQRGFGLVDAAHPHQAACFLDH